MFTNDPFEGISLLQYDRVSIDRPTKQLKYMYLPFVIGFRDFFLDLFRLEKNRNFFVRVDNTHP